MESLPWLDRQTDSTAQMVRMAKVFMVLVVVVFLSFSSAERISQAVVAFLSWLETCCCLLFGSFAFDVFASSLPRSL